MSVYAYIMLLSNVSGKGHYQSLQVSASVRILSVFVHVLRMYGISRAMFTGCMH